MMVLLEVGQEEQKSFLEILKKYENNQLNSFSTYEKFETDFNLTRDRFIEEHYNPKVARLKNFKNVSGYLIIILTFFLALLNLAKERKDTIKH